MENKCTCGYRILTAHEQNMFDMYGCARTTKNQETQFSGISIETCDSQGNPPGDIPNPTEEYEAFKEQYINSLKKNGTKKS